MTNETDTEAEALAGVLSALPEQIEKLAEVREQLLSTAVLLAEIPAPTFAEEERIRFIHDLSLIHI